MGGAGLFLVGPQSLPSTEPRAATTVTLAPGSVFSGTVSEMEAPGKRVLQIGRLPDAFVDAFARSEAVTATVGGKAVTASIKGAGEAMRHAAMCRRGPPGNGESTRRPMPHSGSRRVPPRKGSCGRTITPRGGPREGMRAATSLLGSRSIGDPPGQRMRCRSSAANLNRWIRQPAASGDTRMKYQPARSESTDGRRRRSIIIKSQWCMDVKSL